MSGAIIKALSLSNAPTPLRCTDTGALLVDVANASAPLVATAAQPAPVAPRAESDSESARQSARLLGELLDVFRNGLVTFQGQLPSSGAHVIQAHAGESITQLVERECCVYTIDLDNVCGEEVVVRFLDGVKAPEKVRAPPSSSFKRAWRHKKNKISPEAAYDSGDAAPADAFGADSGEPGPGLPDEISAVLEFAARQDEEMAALVKGGKGDLERSKLSYTLRPGAMRTITFPAGVHFSHGFAVALRFSQGVEPKTEAVHVQASFI